MFRHFLKNCLGMGKQQMMDPRTSTFFKSLKGTAVASVVFVSAFWNNARLSTKISLGLISIHVVRRLYESYFVTVYSNSKMSIAHYTVGVFFYSTMQFCLSWSNDYAVSRGPVSISVYLLLAFFSEAVQHLALRQLASLRKPALKGVNDNGILAARYVVPRGSMFTRVTCPHLTAEIATYTLTQLFLLGLTCTIFSVVLLFVCTNQVCAARLQYRWYQQNFPHFTRTRTSLLPGLF